MTIRRDGRWGGRLSSRPLLAGDTTVDALSEAERDALASVWLARSATEHRVATSFAVIRDSLRALRAGASLVALAERAIDDEHRHAEICRVTASSYAGRELEPPAPLPFSHPKHERAPEDVRHALWVVGQCCFNETLASGFLEAACGVATGPMASRALRELLSDEIDHARLGWAFLAGLDPALRGQLGPWLPALARANLRMWREAPREHPDMEPFTAQGAPSRPTVEAALLTALRDLVVPGLHAMGLPVAPVSAWLHQGAPTSAPG